MTLFSFSIDKWLSYFLEILLSVWFFRSKYTQEEHQLRKFLSLLPLLCYLPLIIDSAFLGNMVFRYFYRWLLLFLMQLILRGKDLQRCLYLSALCGLTFAAQQNLTIVSKTITRIYITDAVLLFTVKLLLEGIIPFVIFTLVSHCIDFSRVIAFKTHQVILLSLLTPVILYVKNSFYLVSIIDPSEPDAVPLTISSISYPLIISALSLVIIAYYDRFWQLRNDREEQLLLDVARQYQFRDLQNQLTAQEENRAIIHDMKNHLLALSGMGTTQQQEYIGDLLQQMDDAGITADTGNQTLNVLLVQKQKEALAAGVRLVVELNLQEAEPLSAIDTCSIFGNALDNALEAAKLVPEQQDRYIRLRGGRAANLYVISITNSCTDAAVQNADGLLRTIKADPAHHGIGMSSMRRTVNHCGGSLAWAQRNGSFTLTISLPAAKQE